MNGERMAYVSRIQPCGCVAAVMVDMPEFPDNNDCVLEFERDHISRAYIVEHLPLAEAQALPWGWPCEHMKAATADAERRHAERSEERASTASKPGGGSS